MTAVTAKAVARDTTGWITEWYGNPQHCTDAVADALTIFSLDVVGVVVEYLKSSEPRAFGLKELQAAYGKDELEAQAGGAIPERPMPREVELLMHRDLEQVFSAATCAYWPTKRKISEVFCAYFKPQNISAQKAEVLAKTCGVQFVDETGHCLAKDGNAADPEASWILFPDEPISTDLRTCGHQLSLVRAKETAFPSDSWQYLYPKIGEVSFCIFTKYACTKTRIYGENPWKGTRIFTSFHLGYLLYRGLDRAKNSSCAIAGFGEDGLHILDFSPDDSNSPHHNQRIGIAPMLQFIGKTTPTQS